jgi:hypothetical protein
MSNNRKKPKISIEYKNDENATNKLIDFIIDFLLENNVLSGENIDQNRKDVSEQKKPDYSGGRYQNV